MDCRTPGFHVLHHLLEFGWIHVHRVSHAIQPSHLLLPSSSFAFNFSQNKGLYQGVSSSHQMAKASVLQLHHQSIQWILRVDFLWDWLIWSASCPRDSQHLGLKTSVLWCSVFFMVQLSHMYMTTGKTIALALWTFVDKVMSLHFNTLSRFVIAFLPRSKCLFISWLQSPSAVTLEPKKIKSVTTSSFSPSVCHEVMRPNAMILVFWMLNSKPAYSLSSSTFNKRLFSASTLSAIEVVSSAYRRLLIFLWAVLIPAMLHPAQHFMWCTLHIYYIKWVTKYSIVVFLS